MLVDLQWEQLVFIPSDKTFCAAELTHLCLLRGVKPQVLPPAVTHRGVRVHACSWRQYAWTCSCIIVPFRGISLPELPLQRIRFAGFEPLPSLQSSQGHLPTIHPCRHAHKHSPTKISSQTTPSPPPALACALAHSNTTPPNASPASSNHIRTCSSLPVPCPHIQASTSPALAGPPGPQRSSHARCLTAHTSAVGASQTSGGHGKGESGNMAHRSPGRDCRAWVT